MSDPDFTVGIVGKLTATPNLGNACVDVIACDAVGRQVMVILRHDDFAALAKDFGRLARTRAWSVKRGGSTVIEMRRYLRRLQR